ncbi:MAG TPA: zinc-binding dehydrogenase [Planctomycetota bacterium]|jgi:2-desacetyl-2-hydroxyethyl bacteriochlorophyllide A dehydrogenase
MKALVNTAPGKLEMQDWPDPQPGSGQVRVRTAACGICATDIEMIAGWSRTGFPAIPGHEWSGYVEALGFATPPELLGKPCVAENVWTDGGEVGFEHPGGYGQFLITEAKNVRVLPPEFPITTAALIEPLAVCVRGMNRLKVALASLPAGTEAGATTALVIGDGPIGLLMVPLLRRAGVKQVVLIGGRETRLLLAKEFGAATLNRRELGERLKETLIASPNYPFSCVIEASGSPDGAQMALDMVAREGKVLVLGDYDDAHANFRWNHLLHREIELVGSNASAGAWDEAVRLATTGAVQLEKLITHRIPVSRFAEGMELVRGRRADVIKVVMEW